MINDRQEIIDEMMLREQIRRIIRIVKENKNKEDEAILNEEQALRSVVRKLILMEASASDPVETSPRSGSTVENFLEELLQNTIKQVIDDYEKLGEKEEREGFFAGFLAALRNKFNEFDAVDDSQKMELDEADIDIEIADDEELPPGEDLLIPSGEETDLQPDEPEEEEEEAEDISEPPAPPEKGTAEYKFGYNIAQETIPKVVTQVLSGYEQFTKVNDQERANIYRDWAIINYGLHMINKEKLITGEFPDLPADFAAEIEKFRTQGVENLPAIDPADIDEPVSLDLES
tara:strand:+ start:484 stop:1350 length:867 start_codon:yes stop_codon:yes gene_type:complete